MEEVDSIVVYPSIERVLSLLRSRLDIPLRKVDDSGIGYVWLGEKPVDDLQLASSSNVVEVENHLSSRGISESFEIKAGDRFEILNTDSPARSALIIGIKPVEEEIRESESEKHALKDVSSGLKVEELDIPADSSIAEGVEVFRNIAKSEAVIKPPRRTKYIKAENLARKAAGLFDGKLIRAPNG